MNRIIGFIFSNMNLSGFRKLIDNLRIDPSGRTLLRLLKGVSSLHGSHSRYWNPLLVNEGNRSLSGRTNPKILVVAHLHYPQFVDRLLAAIPRWADRKVQFVVTTSNSEVYRLVNAARNIHPNLEVQLHENRGRNFGPLLIGTRGLIREHDYLIHVHSKVSRHADESMVKKWVDAQWSFLVDTPKNALRALDIMEEDKSLVLAYPDVTEFLPPWAFSWLSNLDLARSWQSRLGFTVNEERIAYPAGGMFLLRVDAYEVLWRYEFKESDFPPENGQKDGTLQHVFERVLGVFATQRGNRHLVYLRGQDAFTSDSHFIYQASETFVPPESAVSSRDLKMVTFDFFDTLHRRAFHFEDMAKLMAGELISHSSGLTAGDYVLIRNQVEARLRSNLLHSGDISLQDICLHLGKELGIEPSILKDAEEESEMSIALPRIRQVQMLWSLFNNGVRIGIVSDTYYSTEFVRRLALEIGLPTGLEYFISSELGLRKDRGDMWEHLKKVELPEGERHIHFGDNPHSDIQMASDRGIRAFLILKSTDKWGHLGLSKIVPNLRQMDSSSFRYLSSVISDFGEV